MPHTRVLSDRYRVFEISPIGYGRSDRVRGYAGELLVDQVCAVLDQHDVDRFVVWGYSAGGGKALCIARATDRVAGLVWGGYSPLNLPTPGILRQMDKRMPADTAARSFWAWIAQFDWADELRAMSCPRLLFWGSEDTSVDMAKRIRRSRGPLEALDVDLIEFPGVGHMVGGDETLLRELVFPAVTSWIERRLGASW